MPYRNEVDRMEMQTLLREVIGVQDPAVIGRLCEHGQIITLRRGQLLARAGEEQTQVPFLIEGIYRGYFLDVNGKEITDSFGFQPGAAAVACLFPQTRARISIEMLTAGSLFILPASYLYEEIRQQTELLTIYNRYLIRALDFHWEMKRVLSQYPAMDRYRWFLRHYPLLNRQVSNKCIASFLGMNPVTLSRLRRTLRSEDPPRSAALV